MDMKNVNRPGGIIFKGFVAALHFLVAALQAQILPCHVTSDMKIAADLRTTLNTAPSLPTRTF